MFIIPISQGWAEHTDGQGGGRARLGPGSSGPLDSGWERNWDLEKTPRAAAEVSWEKGRC